MFKKKEKQVILFDIVDERSNIRLSDYFIPTKEFKPKWFKNLKQNIDPTNGMGNVITCPSFIELFKNSYTYVSPCDINIEVSRLGHRAILPDPKWFMFDSHTHKNNAPSQMGKEWPRDLYNLKFVPRMFITTNIGKVNMVIVPAFFHNPYPDIIIAPGIFELTPSVTINPNLNTFIDLKDIKNNDSKKIKVKAGDPLAMFYFPNGILDIKKSTVEEIPRKKFFLDHSTKIKNCPFH